VRLDVGDVRHSARKGVLRIHGKGDKVREVPIHAKLRPGWSSGSPNALPGPAPAPVPRSSLNTKGGRLSARAAGGIIAAIAEQAALDDDPTAHVLRHTFATSLVRGQTRPARGRRAPGALPPGHHPAVQLAHRTGQSRCA
jgi:site-specific recombinase XerD